MLPDIVVEVSNGTVVGVYSDLPVSVVILDWDNIAEPDGETAFLVPDADGQPLIGVATPIRPEPYESMGPETRQIIGFLTPSGG